MSDQRPDSSVQPSDSNDDGMACEHAQRQIERMAVDNDLRDVERHMLQLHLRGCAVCRKAFENFRKLEIEMKQAMVELDTAPRFTERVMAVLPAAAPGVSTTHKQRVPVNRESSVFVTGSYVRSAAPASPPAEPRPFLRRYTSVWIGAGLTVTLIAVLGFYASYARVRGENAPPCVASVSGHVLRVLPSNEQERTLTGDYIGAKEYLLAGEKAVELRLESEKKFIARVVLAPRSRLRALNRHTYQVMQGAVYFQVAKDRPGKEDEVFVVEAAMRARVQVTGTAFCVDLQNASSNGALIVVEEGTVQVSASGMRQVALQAGEEIDVAAADGGPRPANLVARMEWMRPPTVVAAQVGTPSADPTQAKTEIMPSANIAPEAPPIDWNAIVADLPVAGQSFNNAWENLTQRVGPSQSLRNVQMQFTPHMDGDAMRVRFSAHAPLSLKNFVSWLARDVGCRFEIRDNGAVTVRRAVAGELPGMSTDGVLPPDMKSRLRTPPDDTVALREAATLDEFMDRLGRRARLTIVAIDPALFNAYAAAPAVERNPLKYKTAGEWLRYAEKVCGARSIWYDGVIYFAPLDTVEELTRVQRSAEIDAIVAGSVLVPEIARNLRDIASNLRYESAAQAGIKRAGTPALFDVAVAPLPTIKEGTRGGLLLRYTTGIAGDELVATTLAQLKAGAPRANDPTRLFSQPLPPGTIRDMDELLEMSRKKLVAAESRVKIVPFTRQSFVAKNLDFGEALEWAAWLGGAGLRQENGTVIVDEISRCYGPAKLQVLVLEGVPDALRPAAAARVAALCPELYPSFFKDVRFYPLHGRIAFSGDLRQLLLAQRIAAALEDGFARGDVTSMETWMPPARTKLNARLREKVQSGGRLAGTFAGVLRQGSLASQLPGTVLIDPQSMKDAAALPVDVTATTLQDVLQQLAKQTKLSMTIEGDVVWFHP